jgi:hypothetical protein
MDLDQLLQLEPITHLAFDSDFRLWGRWGWGVLPFTTVAPTGRRRVQARSSGIAIRIPCGWVQVVVGFKVVVWDPSGGWVCKWWLGSKCRE